MENILPLAQLRKQDLPLAGGKGANLGELIRAGLPVPPGFVISTKAYQSFVAYNNLQAEITRLAAGVQADDPITAEQISSQIRALFDRQAEEAREKLSNKSENTPTKPQGAPGVQFPPELWEEIALAYRALDAEALAVRSSATAEDLPEASFAGQHDSFLNVCTLEELQVKICQCWSSLWSARALLYRKQQNIALEHVAQAVVVQQMVQARSAGVLFTINPFNGREDELLVNATWGLGELLVSGQVTPDMLVIDKRQGRVKERSIGSKTEISVPDATHGGTKTIALAEEQRQQNVLTAEQVTELSELAQHVETHFGTAQDIEWAATTEKIYLVQARPITSFFRSTSLDPAQKAAPSAVPMNIPSAPGDDSWNREQELPAQEIDLWTRTNMGENLPFPITPLTETNFGAIFALDTPDPQQSFQTTKRIYGRLYMNEGGIVRTFHQDFGLPASFLTRSLGMTQRNSYPNTLKPLRLLRKLPALLGMSRTTRQPQAESFQPEKRQNAEEFFAQINRWVADFRTLDLLTLSDQELWAHGIPIWRPRGAHAFATNMRLSMPGSLYYLLSWLVTRWTGEKNLGHELISSPSGVLSSEIGLGLWQMAQKLKELQLERIVLDEEPISALEKLRRLPEGRAFIEQLEAFLAIHGHRCPNELEFFNPRWEEAPEQVVELVGNYLQAGQQIDPGQAQARQQAHREEAIAHIEKKIGPIRRALFRLLLKQVQQAIVIRENSKYHMSKLLFPMRLLYAELGRRWTERGWLQQANDIFFLMVREIEEICTEEIVTGEAIRQRIAQRRVAYDFWLSIQAPEAIDAQGRTLIEGESGERLTGVAASSGRVRGRARLVNNVEEAMKLQPGDILITMATDPGWTPVFPLVSGLVLEIGGQLSHGAIIAREFGLPAVINVPGAMRRIQEGQILEVDGRNGIVYLTPCISAEEEKRELEKFQRGIVEKSHSFKENKLQ